MHVQLLAQAPLFAASTACSVFALRSLPHLSVHGRRTRPWLAAIAGVGSLVFALSIGILGHTPDEDYLDPSSYEIKEVAFSAIATFLLALAAATFWIALRFDPSRGRRRCARCWYDMSATPTPTCPECGRVAASERGLLRTRRSSRAMLAAVFVGLLSYVALKTPRIPDFGWGIFIPTTPMILALPHVPLAALTDEDEREWTLADRCFNDDLWEWQNDLLKWRAQRVIASSSDLAALQRASDFVDHDHPPRMCEAAVIAYAAASLAADADSTDLPDLTPFIPEDRPLSPKGQQIIADAAIRAIREGPVLQARAAIVYFSHSSPDHSNALADAIADRIERDEERLVSGAVFRLGLLANKSEHAWSLYLPLVTHSNTNIRRLAVRLLTLARSRRDAIVPLIEKSLDDPSDDVATSAVSAMRSANFDLSPYRERLLDIARARPVVGGEVVWALGVKKDAHPDVLSLLRERLQSDNQDQLWITLGAIERLGPLASSLRPDLDAFAAGPHANLVESELQQALNALEQGDSDDE